MMVFALARSSATRQGQDLKAQNADGLEAVAVSELHSCRWGIDEDSWSHTLTARKYQMQEENIKKERLVDNKLDGNPLEMSQIVYDSDKVMQ